MYFKIITYYYSIYNIQDHLKSKYDQVQETAMKLNEVSELNTMLSEQVIEQSYKIEQIYKYNLNLITFKTEMI